MGRLTILIFFIFMLISLAGCDGVERTQTWMENAQEVPATPLATTATVEDVETTTGASDLTGVHENDLLSSNGEDEPEFVKRSSLSGGSGYGTEEILAVRFGEHENFERVVLDLGTGSGSATTVPEWNLTSRAGSGEIRLNLPTVITTDVSEGAFGGDLLDSFYVVRSPEGGMFVDIFASEAFVYRVIPLSDPARLVVDLRPSGREIGTLPFVRSGNTVLTQPRAGAAVSGPLVVCGYSRNPEAINVLTIRDRNGRMLVREVITSSDWAGTWGYFEATIEVPKFSGRGIMRVGAGSARDGSFEGVEIPVWGAG